MQKIQSFDWLHFKFKFSIFQIQNKLLCLSVFPAKRIFKTHQHYCFLCFHSRWGLLWFHKDREITKNLFTLAENNFVERKLSCTRLNFGEIVFAVTKLAVPGGHYRSILPLGHPIRTQNSPHTGRSRSLPYNKWDQRVLHGSGDISELLAPL